MFEWLKRKKERRCIEQAEEIVGTRRELQSAQRTLDEKSKAFWTSSSGLVLNVKGEFATEYSHRDSIRITDWETIKAIRILVLSSEVSEVKRLKSKLDALVGGR